MNSQPAKPWTCAQVLLLHQCAPGAEPADWPGIAEACGHSVGSCRTTFVNLRRHLAAGKPLESFGKASRANKKRGWTPAEEAELFRLRTVEKKGFFQIDDILERCYGASSTKFGQLFGPVREQDEPPAPKAIHAPSALPQHTTLTAAFCGDPLPGRSVWDKIQAGLLAPPAYLGRATHHPRAITLASEPLR